MTPPQLSITATALLAMSACMAGASDDLDNGLDVSVAAQQRGIDYAWSRPSSPRALANAGYSFVARYVSYDTSGKNITASEAQGLFAAGIDVVANWEWGASDALNGFDTGVAHAQKAQQLAVAAGMPADRPIYFSVDFDATEGQQAAIDRYFDGVASVIGAGRTGAYGGYYVVKRLFDHGKIQWGWQTYAWSGGQWDARAQMRQIQNGVTVAGAACDIDISMAADFGQWGPNPPPAASSGEGAQAFVTPNQQHYLAIEPNGTLRHSWWDGATRSIAHDSWGTGVTGRPVGFVAGADQHVFARGSNGSLEHYFWDPSAGLQHDTWGGGLASDPTAAAIGAFQDVWAVDAAGALQHWYWGPEDDRSRAVRSEARIARSLGRGFPLRGPSTSGVQHDTWGSGVAGRPSAFVYRSQQHVFVRGTSGSLEHFWWASSGGAAGSISHDTWGSGLAGDPVALAIGDFQDVWAVDTAGKLQHWFWGPSTNGVQHDTWGSGAAGRPTAFVYGDQQHVFARGSSGGLEHYWWAPSGAGGSISHDTWGSGVTTDPTALVIANQQHVWAQDSAGDAQHWYWDPATNQIVHDNWAQ